MFGRLKEILQSRAGHGCVAISPYVYRVDINGEKKDLVALNPPGDAFSDGLEESNIVGIVRGLIRPGQVDFEIDENPGFVERLHAAIAHEAPRCPRFQMAARRQKDGWIYVIDGRTPDPAGAVPPEDILGGFELHAGVCKPGGYVRNPNHRLLTRRGFFQLESEFYEAVMARLQVNER